jgi:L-cysteine:1D-myo-inositol 2-amino-2-deoxy-alpha-D-glucopyranoside ligase
MRLYNTLSRDIETFAPQGESATVYVCGITPYDTTHLGHAFTYTALDILIRYLEFRGYSIEYVQNVTDIDDDILRKAAEVGENWNKLGDRWTAHFIRDMIALNVRAPDHFPRATSIIPQIIDVVQQLLDAGVAYESGGSVYFHIDAWSEYGTLSRLPRDAMLPIANERGNDPEDPNKHDPLDFVLWQAGSPGEPSWESPWGPGRPGWHIECSTMAMHLLGNTIDIHGGGGDLAFPHHESEIAQAEGATGERPFVRRWVHTAMVRHEGEKMSKSLGNLVMVDDLLKDWSPDALRLYLAGHHYREPWSHDLQELEQAEKLARKLVLAAAAESGPLEPLGCAFLREAFVEALDEDLDTPHAIHRLEQLAEAILDGAAVGQDVRSAQRTLRSMSQVLGLRLDAQESEERVTNKWGDHLRDFMQIGVKDSQIPGCPKGQ